MTAGQMKAKLASVSDDTEVVIDDGGELFEPELSRDDGRVIIECGGSVDDEDEEEIDIEEDEEDFDDEDDDEG